MLNRDVLTLFNVLSGLRVRAEQAVVDQAQGLPVQPMLLPAPFTIAAAVNTARLEPQARALSEVLSQPWAVQMRAFQVALAKLQQEHAVLPEGETVLQPGKVYQTKDDKAFTAAQSALRNEYADALKGNEAAESLLAEEAAPVSLVKVSMTDLPPTVTMLEGAALQFMVNLPEPAA